MTLIPTRRTVPAALMAGLILAMTVIATARPAAQSVAAKETVFNVERALQRLPYYGVFDFLAFGVDRGTVTLAGLRLPGQPQVRRHARRQARLGRRRSREQHRGAAGVPERRPHPVGDVLQHLHRRFPVALRARRRDERAPRRPASPGAFPGMQPFGTYPIHIIVKGGRTTLLGVVDNESDKTVAGMRAREVSGVFGVENELIVGRQEVTMRIADRELVIGQVTATLAILRLLRLTSSAILARDPQSRVSSRK